MSGARELLVVGAMVASLFACAGGQTHGATGGSSGEGTGAQHINGTSSDAGTAVSSADSGVASADAGSTGFIQPSGPQAQQAAQIYAEGAAAYQRSDFPAAARAFQRAYELFPAPAMAYNLARVFERMGEVDQAIHYFEIVQHANPPPTAEQNTEIERRVAGLRAYEQRRREGIAQTLPTSDALSQEGNTWFQRGVSLYRRRQYRQALIAFEQAYNYLQTPELFYNLAVTHRALHNVDRALEFMREYLDARRGTPEESWIEEQVRALEAQRR